MDECLDAESIHKALVGTDARVERHRDHFAPGTPDIEWLPVAGANGWVVLTKDDRIRRVDLEIQALWNAGVAAFIFRGASSSGAQMAAALAGAVPGMARLVNKMARPFIGNITKSGEVVLLKDSGRKSGQKR